MTNIRGSAGQMKRFLRLLSGRRDALQAYATAISGSAGRLVFSLIYFIALANTLTIADFGLFATASAAGVMLSRILAFGFISALYRVATVKPRLIGTFSAGFAALGVLSLPALAAASWLVFLLFFSGDISPPLFALVVVAEALLWRPAEVVVIVNNGMGRFGRAATLVITGTLTRAGAALLFALSPRTDLAAWCWLYLAANLVALAVAILVFHPRQRLRLRMALYWRRLPDSLYVAGAEVLFYLQMEFDKLVVLAYGGPHLAGIYAIVMRLVDLTAIPIRTFSMMLVQKMMRAPDMLARRTVRAGIEGGVFLVSTVALLALALLLHFFPNALGRNVAEAAPLVGLALFVPGLRNLVEYQAELLFARGQTALRAVNLALLAGAKALLLIWLLNRVADTAELVLWLNGAFAALYLLSAVLTYSALGRPAKRH
ncbi:transporter [Mesorhizobium sp. L-8-10]|uniref:lipopolysaccharide biosynthesis protein n=1 Tax=unclassified Mesorhizobium TaxID=325217 RepID=UPI0019272EF6|nr:MULTISPECIES: lipopolysaccharide biosynthesis protein [unclassified Mesorhizobium]BCH26675.1 transporter [Mesorhizobium sp. L-8-3]BCH34650.1 transporter [Mesorhizobium sp. L-8-10]